MSNKDNTINVRIPPALKQAVETVVSSTGKYNNSSDFVRQAIRDLLKREKPTEVA